MSITRVQQRGFKIDCDTIHLRREHVDVEGTVYMIDVACCTAGRSLLMSVLRLLHHSVRLNVARHPGGTDYAQLYLARYHMYGVTLHHRSVSSPTRGAGRAAARTTMLRALWHVGRVDVT